jgi:hypothetical protein
MTDIETNAIENKVVFVSGSDSFTVRDLVDAARFRGEVELFWKNFLRLVEAEKKADERDLEMDDSAIDAAAEQFRYEHDLITAEETERWLEERGLSLSDFSDYFVRHYWGDGAVDLEPEAVDYLSAPNEVRELLTIELILSGELDRMAKRLSWRVVARRAAEGHEIDPGSSDEEQARFFERSGLAHTQFADWLKQLGRDQVWFGEALSMEAIYRHTCDALLTRQAREREIAALRLPLTRFEVETIELDSLDAAREALLCARDDGLSMEEVAAEGRYPYQRADILLEDVPEDLQQKFLSVTPGEILEPISRGDGFHLCRIIEKAEPNIGDSAVMQRAEKRILERHFEDLTAKHIQWHAIFA